jgi:hypothetical protein
MFERMVISSTSHQSFTAVHLSQRHSYPEIKLTLRGTTDYVLVNFGEFLVMFHPTPFAGLGIVSTTTL